MICTPANCNCFIQIYNASFIGGMSDPNLDNFFNVGVIRWPIFCYLHSLAIRLRSLDKNSSHYQDSKVSVNGSQLFCLESVTKAGSF